MKPQTIQVLNHLTETGTITPLEALYAYGIMRLGARVMELRRMGYKVTTKMETRDGKTYARYSLET